MAIKDFSRARPDVVFQLDGETFRGQRAIPADRMVELMGNFDLGDGDSPAQVLKAMKDIFGTLLEPASADRLVERMSDFSNPIEFDQANDIVMWLFDQFGMRPTEQPGPSGPGQASPESGTTLTAPTSVVESTSSPSPGTGS